jgi:hypothetical protein
VSIAAAAWERPVGVDELTVPAQQRRGRNEEGCPALTSTQRRKRCQHSAIGRGEARSRNLAPQYCELVTKDCDLDVLLVGPRTDAEENEELSNEQECDRRARRTIVADLRRPCSRVESCGCTPQAYKEVCLAVSQGVRDDGKHKRRCCLLAGPWPRLWPASGPPS